MGGWYLPSLSELLYITNNYSVINTAAKNAPTVSGTGDQISGVIWTSTSVVGTTTQAYTVEYNTSTGVVSTADIDSGSVLNIVRPFRQF